MPRGRKVASGTRRYSARIAQIALIGHLCRDVVAGAAPRPGGAVYYSARAFALLGSDVSVGVACAARDRDALLPRLEKLGLPTSWRPSATTTAYAFHYEGDHRVMLQQAIGEPWTPAQAVAAAGDADWVYVGALVRSDFSEEALTALASGGRRLLVDAQGLVRTPALGPLRRDADIGDVLRHVTILKANEDEATILAGGLDEGSIRGLGVPEVVVTLGSQGSFVVAGDTVERIATTPVVGPVDPTGAGDMFSAAYLDARSRGIDPAEAARSASTFVGTFIADRSHAT